MIKTIHRLITRKDETGRYRTDLKITNSPEEIPVVKEKQEKERNLNPKYKNISTRIQHTRINGYKYHIQTIKCIDNETGSIIRREIIHRPL